MDRARYSWIAHASCPFAAPVHEQAFTALVEELALAPGARVLDLGCGAAELSARIAERWDARCVGVDLSAYNLDLARQRAARLQRGSLVVERRDLDHPPEGPWDLIVNIGAMPPGRQVAAIRQWAALLAPGGKILVGDGYWKRAPEAAYLEALGAGVEDMSDRAGVEGLAAATGLRLSRLRPSPDDEFEAYECAYRANIERWLALRPEDPDAAAMRERSAAWWQLFERYGRDTLGFYLALFELSAEVPLMKGGGLGGEG